MKYDKENIKVNLFNKLKQANAFWSYDMSDVLMIPDESIIEKTLIHLDLDEIVDLLKIYPKSFIKNVWIDRLVRAEPKYHNYNLLFAIMLFHIKNPDRYLAEHRTKKEKLLCKE